MISGFCGKGVGTCGRIVESLTVTSRTGGISTLSLLQLHVVFFKRTSAPRKAFQQREQSE